MTLFDSLRVTTAGLALGLVLALLASRAVAILIHPEGSLDPAAFVGAALLLAGASAAAAYLPARRAAALEPSRTLRID